MITANRGVVGHGPLGNSCTLDAITVAISPEAIIITHTDNAKSVIAKFYH